MQIDDIFSIQASDPDFSHLAPARFVPGHGSRQPKAIIVGEAPGRQEDLAGLPFVGPSGKLLDELLEVAKLSREEVWITNVLKFRPPKNRNPLPLEISASLPYLKREVSILSRSGCRSIVGLGRTACSAIAARPISPLAKHGTWRTLPSGWNLYITCHPSWGLRSPAGRESMLKDFLQLGYDINND